MAAVRRRPGKPVKLAHRCSGCPSLHWRRRSMLKPLYMSGQRIVLQGTLFQNWLLQPRSWRSGSRVSQVRWCPGPKAPSRDGLRSLSQQEKLQGQSQCTHAPQQNRGKLYRSRSPHVHAHMCTSTLGRPGIEPGEHRLTLSVKIEGHVLPLHNDRPLAPSLSSPPTLVRSPRVQSLDLLLQQKARHTQGGFRKLVCMHTHWGDVDCLSSFPILFSPVTGDPMRSRYVWHSSVCARGLTSATRVHGSQPLQTGGPKGVPAPLPTMVGTCSTRFGPGCQATMAIARWMALVSGGRPASAPVLYVNSTKPCASSFSSFVQSCM